MTFFHGSVFLHRDVQKGAGLCDGNAERERGQPSTSFYYTNVGGYVLGKLYKTALLKENQQDKTVKQLCKDSEKLKYKNSRLRDSVF